MSVGQLYELNKIIEDRNIRPSTHMYYEQPQSLVKRKAAMAVQIASRMTKTRLPKDKRMLFNMKTKQEVIDKEQLYQENIELKLKNHTVSEELLKLKTKFMQIEIELQRRDDIKDPKLSSDKFNSVNLVQGLKQSLRDVKLELEQREKEVFKLKSNMKCSRNIELEVEVQTYIDECTRLRHHLEETMKIKSEPSSEQINSVQFIQGLKKENNELKNQLNAARVEISDLNNKLIEEHKQRKPIIRKVDLNSKNEVLRLKALLKESSKEFTEKEEKLKLELSGLKAKLDKLNLSLKQKPNFTLYFKPKAPKLFYYLFECIPSKFKSISDLCTALKSIKSFEALHSQLKLFCPKLSLSQLTEVSDLFSLDKPDKFPDLFKEWFPLYHYTQNTDSSSRLVSSTSASILTHPAHHKPPSISIVIPEANQAIVPKKSSTPQHLKTIQKDEVKDLLLKVQLVMQIHRVPREEFSKLISHEELVTVEFLGKLFQSEPFKMEETDARRLGRFLVEPNELYIAKPILSSLAGNVFNKFSQNTEDWDIFSVEHEEKFDEELREIVKNNKNTLETNCLLYDPNKEGSISDIEFEEVLKSLSIVFSDQLKKYCRLLFYSCNNIIRRVPYDRFLLSYGSKEDAEKSEDMFDEEVAVIVRSYLEKIAEKMIKDNISTKDLFVFNQNGLISGKDFCDGIYKLGITDIPNDHMAVILEALQYEGVEEVCVLIDELEDILQHYGVGEHTGRFDEPNDDTIKFGQSEDHYEEDYESEGE